MKFVISIIVAPLIVEIVSSLFDHWLDDRDNKRRK
ncbi:type I toxin-antitoxin system Fst family toxin [Lactobacillus sp. PV034]|nr:type I toxin-antitoxin system Fst family toxin [Lactobacillus sp. PV034]QNQ80218.1 type I toxin-antitoxin system Fst family toxin [Lactobacillus sp. PV034]